MSISRTDAFPTPIWHLDVPGSQQLNPSLLEDIHSAQERDGEGLKVSNVLGWHSKDNLHQYPNVKTLLKSMSPLINTIVEELEWDLAQVMPSVVSCWAMVNPKYAYSAFHHHPNSVLSGVYYVQAPEGCGDLYFHDPRAGGQILLPPVRQKTPWTMGKISSKSQVGACLIFPSWFWHGVEPNLCEEERISISFNIGVAKNPNQTSSL